MSDFELTAAEFRARYDRVKHMSRWGPADRRGALNNVSPAQVVAAARTSPAAASYNGIGADAVTAAGATELDDLVAVCEELNRWSFLCVVTPLRLRAATGSPVNPIAIF